MDMMSRLVKFRYNKQKENCFFKHYVLLLRLHKVFQTLTGQLGY